MWTREIFGTDLYHIIASFIIYSMIGWLVESIYMSFCERKIVNRGFAKGPFCPIYGFGATVCYYLLLPFSHSKVLIYLIGAVMATIFEYLVGILMIKMFGELWWDYNDKPFNYKGILCLESTLAWGAYAIIVVYFLHETVLGWADKVGMQYGKIFCMVALTLYAIDFTYHLLKALGVNVKKYRENVVAKYRQFRERF